MLKRSERWEASFSQALQSPVQFALSMEPVPIGALSDGEKRQLSRYSHPKRRLSWLTGRSALKKLLQKFGEDLDTSKIEFPNRRFSLSHTGKVAVAVGVSEESLVQGIGIDLESRSEVPTEAARFFLLPEERTRPLEPAQLARLWTVKEALYKSDTQNQATGIRQYQIFDVNSQSGLAWLGEGPRAFYYATRKTVFGFLTIALSRKKVSHADY